MYIYLHSQYQIVSDLPCALPLFISAHPFLYDVVPTEKESPSYLTVAYFLGISLYIKIYIFVAQAHIPYTQFTFICTRMEAIICWQTAAEHMNFVAIAFRNSIE